LTLESSAYHRRYAQVARLCGYFYTPENLLSETAERTIQTAPAEIMMMLESFATSQFDLLKGDKVHIVGHHFGHNQQGELDVWIESGNKGARFVSQLSVQGETRPVRTEVYATACYILREKTTGRYWFLDQNACGFWLHSDTFFGAKNFVGDESASIQNWLALATPFDDQSAASNGCI